LKKNEQFQILNYIEIFKIGDKIFQIPRKIQNMGPKKKLVILI